MISLIARIGALGGGAKAAAGGREGEEVRRRLEQAHLQARVRGRGRR